MLPVVSTKKWNLIYSVPIWGWNWTSGSAAEDRAKKYGEGVGEGMLQITIFSKRGRRGEVAQPSYLCLNMPLWCKHLTTHRITHVKLKFAIIVHMYFIHHPVEVITWGLQYSSSQLKTLPDSSAKFDTEILALNDWNRLSMMFWNYKISTKYLIFSIYTFDLLAIGNMRSEDQYNFDLN